MEGCIEIGKKCKNCVHYDACLSVLKASFPSISEEQIEHTRNMDNDCPRFKSVEDFTEVVRCRKCKHHHWEQEPCHGRTEHFCSVLDAQVFPDFYCYYGKLKEK